MPLNTASLTAALGEIALPDGRSLAQAGAILEVSLSPGQARVVLAIGHVGESSRARLVQLVEQIAHQEAAAAGEPLKIVSVQCVAPGSAPGPSPAGARVVPLSQQPASKPGASASSGGSGLSLPDVRHIIAVGAGKGGVGKSTVAVNLAVGLARKGHSVGLLDGDIYGPSLPTMLGLTALEPVVVGGMLQPFFVHGVKATTIGKLVDPEKPLIWRGPMAHGAFKQLIDQTQWGPLDYLIIDLPPGTGDVALTMAQTLKLTGAVVVCTPQKVAQDDAIRALRMFQQLGIDVLGVVENMSYFVGDDGKEYDLFGRGGAQQMAQRTGVPLLGTVPITMALRQNSDTGDASANFTSGTLLCAQLEKLVTNLENQAALSTLRTGAGTPMLTIS